MSSIVAKEWRVGIYPCCDLDEFLPGEIRLAGFLADLRHQLAEMGSEAQRWFGPESGPAVAAVPDGNQAPAHDVLVGDVPVLRHLAGQVEVGLPLASGPQAFPIDS